MFHRDGRQYIHRKLTAAEDPRKNFINPPAASHRTTAIKPISQGLRETAVMNGFSQGRLAQANSYKLDTDTLFAKLNTVKHEQDIQESQDNLFRQVHDKLEKSKEQRVFPAMEEDDGQSILDQHVSRVFSPNQNNSPGTISPKHLSRLQHRNNEMTTSMPEFGKFQNFFSFSCLKTF